MEAPILLDTCALAHPVTPIVYEMKKYTQATILRPISHEVVSHCDSRSPDKKAAGQRAARALAFLHSLPHVTVIFDEEPPLHTHTDDDLLARAQRMDGRIFTRDGPLIERAGRLGIDVIAVEDEVRHLWLMAQDFRECFPLLPEVARGEILSVRIVKRGEKSDQGVAYLDDGRKLVINGWTGFPGQVLSVRVAKVVINAAGYQVIFAEPAGDGHQSA